VWLEIIKQHVVEAYYGIKKVASRIALQHGPVPVVNVHANMVNVRDLGSATLVYVFVGDRTMIRDTAELVTRSPNVKAVAVVTVVPRADAVRDLTASGLFAVGDSDVTGSQGP